jgi:hypothetical protein
MSSSLEATYAAELAEVIWSQYQKEGAKKTNGLRTRRATTLVKTSGKASKSQDGQGGHGFWQSVVAIALLAMASWVWYSFHSLPAVISEENTRQFIPLSPKCTTPITDPGQSWVHSSDYNQAFDVVIYNFLNAGSKQVRITKEAVAYIETTLDNYLTVGLVPSLVDAFLLNGSWSHVGTDAFEVSLLTSQRFGFMYERKHLPAAKDNYYNMTGRRNDYITEQVCNLQMKPPIECGPEEEKFGTIYKSKYGNLYMTFVKRSRTCLTDAQN